MRALFTILLLCLGSVSHAEQYGPREFSGQAFTAIVSAFEPEIDAVIQHMLDSGEASIKGGVEIHGVTYYLGEYRGQPVLIFATGISITNAAMTTQMALDYFPVERLIFMGICGGINPQWQPGDVVVPARWFYHDESIYANPKEDRTAGHVLPDYYASYLEQANARRSDDPTLPEYLPFQFIYPSEVMVVKDGQTTPTLTPYFAASEELLAAAQAAVESLPPQTLGEREVQFSVGGHGVSGSVFLDNRDYREWVRGVYTAEVTDMESSAIGQVCTVNGVDWVVIRAVSDLAGGQHGPNELSEYKVSASAFGTTLLFALLDELFGLAEVGAGQH